MQITRMDRAVILGASRGLGAALAAEISKSAYAVTGFARKSEPMVKLQAQFPLFEYQLVDFSVRADQDAVIHYVLEQDCRKVFCVAAGGPFGPFQEREWKDHLWAWEVSFLFYARLLHALLKERKFETQVIAVGSSVAENLPDPKAASYCAAKHALKGLVMSLRSENPDWDLRLFSPGYMDTEMLPRQASVRQQGVYQPDIIARELWLWSLSADEIGHKVYPKHPT